MATNRILTIAATVALFLLAAPAASAQSDPIVVDEGVDNLFPEGMEFRVSVSSDSEIQQIRLRYEILPDGTRASAEPDFEPSASIETSYLLEGNAPPRIYLPPGTTINYYWEATDADGNEARTEEQTFFYDDNRFDWTSIESGGVTVYYYSGSDQDAEAMLNVAAETIADMSELLDASLDFPVRVWVYANRDDMQPALASRSESYEEQIITLGVRVASDTVLVLGNASFDTLRHELAHIVTAVAGESPFGELPAWLDEGTAVYAQSNPGGFGDAISSAIDRGDVLSVRSITSYPGDPGRVTLFYGQGWSLVSYLINTYGEERFAELFATVKAGNRIDDALEQVYGFDQDGLEDEWRAASGLPPRETPEPDDDPPAVDNGDSTDGDSAQQDDDGGASAGAIAAVAIAAALLVVVAVGGGFLVLRRVQR